MVGVVVGVAGRFLLNLSVKWEANGSAESEFSGGRGRSFSHLEGQNDYTQGGGPE